jgi:hypothetical protein
MPSFAHGELRPRRSQFLRGEIPVGLEHQSTPGKRLRHPQGHHKDLRQPSYSTSLYPRRTAVATFPLPDRGWKSKMIPVQDGFQGG